MLAFWVAYLLTRPLGASIGDYLSQPPAEGGGGPGRTPISVRFLVAIVAMVGHLTRTRREQTPRALLGT